MWTRVAGSNGQVGAGTVPGVISSASITAAQEYLHNQRRIQPVAGAVLRLIINPALGNSDIEVRTVKGAHRKRGLREEGLLWTTGYFESVTNSTTVVELPAVERLFG